MAIGKASFPDDKLLDNYSAVIDEIIRAKPSGAQGQIHPLGDPGDDDGPRRPRRHRRQSRRPRAGRRRRGAESTQPVPTA